MFYLNSCLEIKTKEKYRGYSMDLSILSDFSTADLREMEDLSTKYSNYATWYDPININRESYTNTLIESRDLCSEFEGSSRSNRNPLSWGPAIISAAEAALRKDNMDVKLSLKYLIECMSPSPDNYRFVKPSDIDEFLLNNGLLEESNYPQDGSNPCQSDLVTITFSSESLDTINESGLKNFIAEGDPVISLMALDLARLRTVHNVDESEAYTGATSNPSVYGVVTGYTPDSWAVDVAVVPCETMHLHLPVVADESHANYAGIAAYVRSYKRYGVSISTVDSFNAIAADVKHITFRDNSEPEITSLTLIRNQEVESLKFGANSFKKVTSCTIEGSVSEVIFGDGSFSDSVTGRRLSAVDGSLVLNIPSATSIIIESNALVNFEVLVLMDVSINVNIHIGTSSLSRLKRIEYGYEGLKSVAEYIRSLINMDSDEVVVSPTQLPSEVPTNVPTTVAPTTSIPTTTIPTTSIPTTTIPTTTIPTTTTPTTTIPTTSIPTTTIPTTSIPTTSIPTTTIPTTTTPTTTTPTTSIPTTEVPITATPTTSIPTTTIPTTTTPTTSVPTTSIPTTSIPTTTIPTTTIPTTTIPTTTIPTTSIPTTTTPTTTTPTTTSPTTNTPPVIPGIDFPIYDPFILGDNINFVEPNTCFENIPSDIDVLKNYLQVRDEYPNLALNHTKVIALAGMTKEAIDLFSKSLESQASSDHPIDMYFYSDYKLKRMHDQSVAIPLISLSKYTYPSRIVFGDGTFKREDLRDILSWIESERGNGYFRNLEYLQISGHQIGLYNTSVSNSDIYGSELTSVISDKLSRICMDDINLPNLKEINFDQNSYNILNDNFDESLQSMCLQSDVIISASENPVTYDTICDSRKENPFGYYDLSNTEVVNECRYTWNWEYGGISNMEGIEPAPLPHADTQPCQGTEEAPQDIPLTCMNDYELSTPIYDPFILGDNTNYVDSSCSEASDRDICILKEYLQVRDEYPNLALNHTKVIALAGMTKEAIDLFSKSLESQASSDHPIDMYFYSDYKLKRMHDQSVAIPLISLSKYTYPSRIVFGDGTFKREDLRDILSWIESERGNGYFRNLEYLQISGHQIGLYNTSVSNSDIYGSELTSVISDKLSRICMDDINLPNLKEINFDQNSYNILNDNFDESLQSMCAQTKVHVFARDRPTTFKSMCIVDEGSCYSSSEIDKCRYTWNWEYPGISNSD